MLILQNTLAACAQILGSLLTVYFWIVVIACLLSWVRPDPNNVIVRALRTMTEPVFYWVRRKLPFTCMRGIDLSPVVVLVAIELVNRIVVKTLLQYAATM